MQDRVDKKNALNAAEYALGILDADERAAFSAQLKHDSELWRDLIYWENQLSELGLQLPAVTPPDSVWRRIRMQTGVRAAGQVKTTRQACDRALRRWVPWASAAAVSALALLAMFSPQTERAGPEAPLAENQKAPALAEQRLASKQVRPTSERRPDQRVNRQFVEPDLDDVHTPAQPLAWSGNDTATASAAKSSKPVLAIAPDFVGKIQDYASSIGWRVAGYNADGAMRVISTGKPYTKLWKRKTLELWLLPVNSYEEPISLGLLPERGERRIPIPEHVAAEFYTDYNKLAVSREPAGGSASGKPTGDILFITTLKRPDSR